MRPAHWIALFVMNALWAGSYSAFKALSALLHPGEIVTLRYTLAALGLAALWPWLPGPRPRGRDLARCALIGVLVFFAGPRLQVLGVRLGMALGPDHPIAGDSSVVVALEPLITAVAAALFLREHVPARRWAGFAIGITGLLALNRAWRLDIQGAALLANAVFVSSFVCESAYSVVGKPLLQRTSPIKVVAVSLFWGTALNLVVDGPNTLARMPELRASDWAWMGHLVVVCTLIGYTLWFVVIRDTDVSLAALTIMVQPVFGTLIAAVLLNEALHWGQLWATLVIFGGLTLAGFSPRRRPTAP